MDLGYFAINDKKKAVLLNEEALKFTRNDTEDVRWYCKGAAENGDLVLYMGKRAGECIRPEQAQQMIPIDEAWRIVVFQYENSDSFPLIKQLEDTSTFFEGQTLLHTAFSEESLCIELKAKKCCALRWDHRNIADLSAKSEMESYCCFAGDIFVFSASQTATRSK